MCTLADRYEKCQVVIRSTNASPPPDTVINLAEVQLFDTSGLQVDRSLLTFKLSSTTVYYGVPLEARFCNDGTVDTLVQTPDTTNPVYFYVNTGPGQICCSGDGDPDPRLTITYPCQLGLSRVVAYNRMDCCGTRMQRFSLDACISTGCKWNQTFSFGSDVKPVYNFTISKHRLCCTRAVLGLDI